MMITNVHVYDYNLVRILEIRSYSSLAIQENYNDSKEFVLEILMSDNIKNIIKKDYFIKFGDRNAMFIIKYIEHSETKMVIRGSPCGRMLQDRTFIGTISNQNAETALLNAVRNMTSYPPLIAGSPTGIPDIFTRQISNENIEQLTQTICKECDIGYRVIKQDNNLVYQLYKPIENKNLVFSTIFGNLKDESLIQSNSRFKNVAIVQGQGLDDSRITVTCGDVSSAGRLRKELIVDAREIRQEEGETLDAYKERLRQKGLRVLAKQLDVEQISFKISTDDFGTKFDLGDIATCVLTNLGIKFKARITGVIWKIQNNQINCEIEIGRRI